MAYRHRKDIRDRANAEWAQALHRTLHGSNRHVTYSVYTREEQMARREAMVTSGTKSKRNYHYNLKSSTEVDFDNLIKVNQSKKHVVQLDPLRRSMGQLTPSNVLTIKGYYDVKGKGVNALRVKVYKYAKDLGISVETAFSKDTRALLIRLKRDWPVGVDINLG